MQKFNKNALNWPNLNRAYQIARLGGFSIRVAYPKDYVSGHEDYKMIKENLTCVDFKKDGDLLIAIYNEYVSFERIESEYYLFKKFENGLHKLLEKENPTIFKSKETCETLLETAAKRLDFGLVKKEKIYQIAAIIAKLDGKTIIGVEHVAEAIQYNAQFIEDFCVEAESTNMIFGYGISIAPTEHDKIDVENAINYLKSLL